MKQYEVDLLVEATKRRIELQMENQSNRTGEKTFLSAGLPEKRLQYAYKTDSHTSLDIFNRYFFNGFSLKSFIHSESLL